MHQLKEVDMLSAKLDLLMKKLDDGAGDTGVWRYWTLRQSLH